jgi:hypothetical protein
MSSLPKLGQSSGMNGKLRAAAAPTKIKREDLTDGATTDEEAGAKKRKRVKRSMGKACVYCRRRCVLL